MSLKIYLTAVFLLFVNALTMGFALPYLFSEDSWIAIIIGVFVCVVAPVLNVLVVNRVFLNNRGVK